MFFSTIIRILRTIITCAVLIFCLDIVAGQDNLQKGDKIRTVESSGRKLEIEEAFVAALRRLHSVGGALLIENCGQRNTEVSLPADLNRETLMDAIVNADKRYFWERDGNAINLFPQSFALSPLDIKISRFRVRSMSAAEAYARLFELKEVKDGFSARTLQHPAWRFIAGGPSSENREVNVDLTDVTLEQALNSIVRADGKKIWLIKVINCDGRRQYVSSLID